MIVGDVLWWAGSLALAAVVLLGLTRWLGRRARQRHDALAQARRVKICVVKTPDEATASTRWGRS